MSWHSMRVRLTLWNVLILALVLGGFGTALCYAVQANQSAAIDRELAMRARGLSQMLPIGPDGMLSPRSDRRGRGRDRREGEDPLRGGDPRRRGDRSRGPFGIVLDPRRPDFRRPLFFNRQGQPPSFYADDRPWDPATLAPALRGEERYSTVKVDGEWARVLSTPVVRSGQVVGAVQAAHSLGEQQRLVESQFRTLLLLLLPALLVAGLGGLFLTNRALRPVRQVTQAAAQLGAEDLSRRLVVTGKDELSELAGTFNGMLGRLEQAFHRVGEANRKLEAAHSELAQAYGRLERAYEEQRRFTGDASHELRTPLTRIKGSSSLALCGPHDPDEYREALEVVDQAADAMNRIVQDLLLLARSDGGQLPLHPRPVEVREVLSRAVQATADPEAAPVRLQCEPGLIAHADPDHLTRLFINLLENALRHTPREGEVTVSASVVADRLRVQVADTGEGIGAEHLPHLCERFYRVDAARAGDRGGTGLGLAISQSIVEAHGGELRIESELGRGTTVTVELPGAEVATPAASAARQ